MARATIVRPFFAVNKTCIVGNTAVQPLGGEVEVLMEDGAGGLMGATGSGSSEDDGCRYIWLGNAVLGSKCNLVWWALEHILHFLLVHDFTP